MIMSLFDYACAFTSFVIIIEIIDQMIYNYGNNKGTD